MRSYFLQIFGRNARDIACECERSNQPSMVQILHLSNGSTVNEKLSSKKSRLTGMVDGRLTDEEILEEAYLLCLSRPPTKRERDGFLEIFANTPEANQREAVEDLFWSLMTSREFLFQH